MFFNEIKIRRHFLTLLCERLEISAKPEKGEPMLLFYRIDEFLIIGKQMTLSVLSYSFLSIWISVPPLRLNKDKKKI